MKKLYAIITACMLVLVLVPLQMQAQEEFDSEGKDFWFTFMPNWHNKYYYDDIAHQYGGGSWTTDSIYVFITSEFATKGTITYNKVVDGVYKPFTHNFIISQPNEIHKFALHYYYCALLGFNESGYITGSNNDNETITRKSFHVQAEDPVTVYALDNAELSAEACVVLPTPALGKEYYVLAYNSHRYTGISKESSTPSQMAIVGTEDNTHVTVKPSCATLKHGMQLQNITLNKGDVYLIQADAVDNDESSNDLSGTYIQADKNIAVFAGQQRAAVPVPQFSTLSRDCLIEQLIPVHTWGKNAIITPFVISPQSVSTGYSDFYRIIASKDNTMIIVNGTHVETLNAGELYQAKLIPALITSNKPIMVAQYKVSGPSSGGTPVSDPLMLIVPPVEQYKEKYNVISPNSTISESKGSSKVIFVEHYLTIAAPDTSLNNVYLDNTLIPASDFISIPGSTFSYVQKKVQSGGHKITSNAGISVQIYGYGQAISYGYLGGMTFNDVEKEKITYTVDSCATDALWGYKEIFSSGIKSYSIDSAVNCNIYELLFINKKLELKIDKIDAAQNAYFSIKIIDIYNEERIISDSIVTLQLEISGIPNNTLDFGECTIGAAACKPFHIINNNQKDIEVNYSDIIFSQKINFTVAAADFPIIIPPGDSGKINVYYMPTYSGGKTQNIDHDTLLLPIYCSKTFVLQGTPAADTILLNTKCDVPIRLIADSIATAVSIPAVYPNPVVEQGVYKFSVANDDNVYIFITNQTGQISEVLVNSRLAKGQYEILLPTDRFPSGSYFIKLISTAQKSITKLLIQK